MLVLLVNLNPNAPRHLHNMYMMYDMYREAKKTIKVSDVHPFANQFSYAMLCQPPDFITLCTTSLLA